MKNLHRISTQTPPARSFRWLPSRLVYLFAGLPLSSLFLTYFPCRQGRGEKKTSVITYARKKVSPRARFPSEWFVRTRVGDGLLRVMAIAELFRMENGPEGSAYILLATLWSRCELPVNCRWRCSSSKLRSTPMLSWASQPAPGRRSPSPVDSPSTESQSRKY